MVLFISDIVTISHPSFHLFYTFVSLFMSLISQVFRIVVFFDDPSENVLISDRH